MQPDTTLVLGNFEFAREEIPSQIAVGGIQHLVIHELIGGIRVIDAMGRRDNALEWSGWFLGENAQARADYLDAYRIAGKALSLTWSEYNFQVIVREFAPVFRRQFEFTYHIVCEVIADLKTVSTQDSPPPINSAVNDDLNAAATLASLVNDSALTDMLGALANAINAVPTFVGGSRSTVNSVLRPLAAAQARIAILTASGNSVLAVSPGFAGIVPGAAPGSSASALTAQLAATQQLTSLYQTQAVLGRMGNNLGAINASENTETVAGGNLFQMASQEYGDATAWTTIAQANDLTDPVIQGTQTLTIPASSDDSGGILES